jgi:trans-aconitate 2-methyltransferase
VPSWDPSTYLRFEDERGRPFVDLLARVATEPGTVVDLGCGPGHLSGLLRARWPGAAIEGIDASEPMIERARADNSDAAVSYRCADVRGWRADGPVDLLVSNATFQWVPGHLDLLTELADQVAPRGTFAFSVPGNFDAPAHVLLRELAAREPYAEHTVGVEAPSAHDAATYLALLARPGWRVDAWETTYLHLLSGPDPVLRWVSGTGARPVLQALPDPLRARFEAEYAVDLRAAYPEQPHGTVMPFRRVFCVAHRDEAG